MFKPTVRYVLAASLTVVLVGCSSSSKRTSNTVTSSTNPFLTSSKKVQQDLTQTETDLGQLQSQVKFSK